MTHSCAWCVYVCCVFSILVLCVVGVFYVWHVCACEMTHLCVWCVYVCCVCELCVFCVCSVCYGCVLCVTCLFTRDESFMCLVCVCVFWVTWGESFMFVVCVCVLWVSSMCLLRVKYMFYVWHVCVREMNHACVVCVCVLRVCSMNTRKSYVCVLCVTCVFTRERTHLSVWYESLMCVTWVIYLCDMTRFCVWHDSFRHTGSSGNHTVTHCNTLQHTAKHCNTLQHTAPHLATQHHTNTLPHILHTQTPVPVTSAAETRSRASRKLIQMPRPLRSLCNSSTERSAESLWSSCSAKNVCRMSSCKWCVYVYIYVCVCVCMYVYGHLVAPKMSAVCPPASGGCMFICMYVCVCVCMRMVVL